MGSIAPDASARRTSGNNRQKNTATDTASAAPAAVLVRPEPVTTITASSARKNTLTPATPYTR